MKDQVLSVKGTATAYTQECYMPIKKTLEEDMTLTQYTSGKADGLVAKASYTDGGTSYYPNLFSVELNKGAYIDQLYFIISSGAVIDAEVRFQLERGKGTHDWQPVTEKQVFVKNENGVYEELVKKNLHIGVDEPKHSEDVWVKIGKNIIDPKKFITQNGTRATIHNTDIGFEYDFTGSNYSGEGFYTKDIKLKKGETYTLSFETSSGLKISNIRFAKKIGDIDNAYQAPQEIETNKYKITAKQDYNCLRFWITSSANNGTDVGSITNLQLELGDFTNFEQYVCKSVNTKTDKSAYDVFYREDESNIVPVDFSLETGSATAEFPDGFNLENCIIIGHMDRNKWNIPFGNVKEVDAVINGDNNNIQVNSTGNFSGGSARTRVFLMKIH